MTTVGGRSQTGQLGRVSAPARAAAPQVIPNPTPGPAPGPAPAPKDQARVAKHKKAPCAPTGANVARQPQAGQITPEQASRTFNALIATFGTMINGGSDPQVYQRNADRFVGQVKAILGENFATGVFAGVASRVGKITAVVGDAQQDPHKAALVVATILSVALINAVPPVAAPFNALLVGLAGAEACHQWKEALELAVAGEDFEAGMKGGAAAVDTLFTKAGAKQLGELAKRMGDLGAVAVRFQQVGSQVANLSLRTCLTSIGSQLSNACQAVTSGLASTPMAAVRSGAGKGLAAVGQACGRTDTAQTAYDLLPKGVAGPPAPRPKSRS